MCVGTDTLAEAWINESGATTGGTPGDQTGQETRLANASAHPYRSQWTHLLRPPASATTTTTAAASVATLDDLEEVIMALKATHIIFNDGKTIFIADVLAGTYRAMSSNRTLRDTRNVLEKSGGKVVEWKTLGGSGSNKVANPAAFGVRVR
jgi:hypothetical protein